MKLLLDAGHGGIDPGAVEGAVHEADLTLSIVLLAGKLLQEAGFQVIFTRDSGNYVSPSARLKMINEFKPDAFVSVHCNATDNHAATGIETIYRDEYDKPLAIAMQRSLVAVEGIRDRGIKNDIADLKRRLAVLGNLPVPSCLCEVGFLTNPEDLKHIENSSEVAGALVEGVKIWAEMVS